MQGLAKAWEFALEIWGEYGPALLIAAGVVGYLLRWALDQLGESLAARREYHRKMTELMVPKLHEYTEKYYMPTVSAGRRTAEGLRALLDLKSPPSDEQIGRVLYHLGRFFHEQDKWAAAIGGFFFQNLTGEAVASALQTDLNRKWNRVQALTTQDRSKLRKEAGNADSIGDFLEKISGQAQLQQIRDGVRQWLQDDPEAVAFCKAVDLWWKLVHFEINAHLAAWYRQEQRPNLTEEQLSTVKEILGRLVRDREISDRHHREYLKRFARIS